MIIATSEKKARGTRYSRKGHGDRILPDGSAAESNRTQYIGLTRELIPAGQPIPGPDVVFPQAYLNEQLPHVEIKPHFHLTNEFLLMVGGSARLGPNNLKDIVLYYAGRYTAYGPIVAGAEGLNYFTLRNRWDSGTRWMPACREELRAVPRQHREHVAGPLRPATAGELASLSAISRTPLIGPDDDGLGAWLYHLPPNQKDFGPKTTQGDGQFLVVISGELKHQGEQMTPFSCIFVSGDEGAFPLKAGPSGAEILIAQFPVLAPLS